MSYYVNSTRQEYDAYKPIWRKCRDCVDGQESIHRGGQLYLPKLGGQTEQEYADYVQRASFFNATSRTVDAMAGLMFRKEPIFTAPETMISYSENIDLNGNDLHSFANMVAHDFITTGRFGILVDHPSTINEEGRELTLHDVERSNLRPYLAFYTAENIINWRYETINNAKILTMAVLVENVEHYDSEFMPDVVKHYRVLDLHEGKYRVRVFRELAQNNMEKEFEMVGGEQFPTMQGSQMGYIPFFICNAGSLDYTISKPPILDLVNINIAHYRNTADLEHGGHFTAVPTPVFIGHTQKDDSDPITLGGGKAIVMSEPDSDAKFLEYSGQGLGALRDMIADKQQQMAVLGARMLVSEKAAAEAHETHNIKRQGENSILASLAISLEDCLQTSLTLMAKWSGASGDISYKINKDFTPARMSSQDLTAFTSALMSGAISYNDYVYNLKKGEIIDAEKDMAQIQLELESGGAMMINQNNFNQV